jgi:hypothetical protein
MFYVRAIGQNRAQNHTRTSALPSQELIVQNRLLNEPIKITEISLDLPTDAEMNGAAKDAVKDLGRACCGAITERSLPDDSTVP